MNKYKYFVINLILFSLFILSSCKQEEKYENNGSENPVNTKPTLNEYVSEPDLNNQDTKTDGIKDVNFSLTGSQNFNTQNKRMIIKSGEMSIETDNFEETERRIIETVKSFNAYIVSSSSQLNLAGKKQGNLTIRVAFSEFDNLVSSLKQINKLVNLNVTGRDVTDEYIDLEARLKTQRELEARLLKILQEKTTNLNSILEVETKLASVREKIEKTEGGLKYLQNQTAYSNIKVSFYEPSILETSSGGGFSYEIRESITRGLTGLTKVMSGMITFLITNSPLLVILGLFISYGVKYFRDRKTRKVQAGK